MKKIKIYKSFKLKNLSTFRIGGVAQFYCQPNSLAKIQEAIIFAKENNLKIYIIGGGANILFSDGILKGLIISTKCLNECLFKDDLVIAESGISINKLNKKTLSKSLSGLEFSSGLPGTLGGAVYMNARAYGKEFADIIKSVSVLTQNGEVQHLEKSEIGFSYKKSLFMANPELFITSITLQLTKGIKKEIRSAYLTNKKDREKKKQYDYPSAGCVFQNDYERNIITGKLIEELGLKGLRFGDAQISENHGNFIINRNRAKADDVKKLIEHIEKKAYEERGIELKREIRLMGF